MVIFSPTPAPARRRFVAPASPAKSLKRKRQRAIHRHRHGLSRTKYSRMSLYWCAYSRRPWKTTSITSAVPRCAGDVQRRRSWPIEDTTYRPDLLTVIEISPSTIHFQIAGSLWPIRRGCVPLHVHFPSSLSLTMNTSRSLPPLLGGVPQHHPDDHSFSAAL